MMDNDDPLNKLTTKKALNPSIDCEGNLGEMNTVAIHSTLVQTSRSSRKQVYKNQFVLDTKQLCSESQTSLNQHSNYLQIQQINTQSQRSGQNNVHTKSQSHAIQENTNETRMASPGVNQFQFEMPPLHYQQGKKHVFKHQKIKTIKRLSPGLKDMNEGQRNFGNVEWKYPFDENASEKNKFHSYIDKQTQQAKGKKSKQLKSQKYKTRYSSNNFGSGRSIPNLIEEAQGQVIDFKVTSKKQKRVTGSIKQILSQDVKLLTSKNPMMKSFDFNKQFPIIDQNQNITPFKDPHCVIPPNSTNSSNYPVTQPGTGQLLQLNRFKHQQSFLFSPQDDRAPNKFSQQSNMFANEILSQTYQQFQNHFSPQTTNYDYMLPTVDKKAKKKKTPLSPQFDYRQSMDQQYPISIKESEKQNMNQSMFLESYQNLEEEAKKLKEVTFKKKMLTGANNSSVGFGSPSFDEQSKQQFHNSMMEISADPDQNLEELAQLNMQNNLRINDMKKKLEQQGKEKKARAYELSSQRARRNNGSELAGEMQPADKETFRYQSLSRKAAKGQGMYQNIQNETDMDQKLEKAKAKFQNSLDMSSCHKSCKRRDISVSKLSSRILHKHVTKGLCESASPSLVKRNLKEYMSINNVNDISIQKRRKMTKDKLESLQLLSQEEFKQKSKEEYEKQMFQRRKRRTRLAESLNEKLQKRNQLMKQFTFRKKRDDREDTLMSEDLTNFGDKQILNFWQDKAHNKRAQKKKMMKDIFDVAQSKLKDYVQQQNKQLEFKRDVEFKKIIQNDMKNKFQMLKEQIREMRRSTGGITDLVNEYGHIFLPSSKPKEITPVISPRTSQQSLDIANSDLGSKAKNQESYQELKIHRQQTSRFAQTSFNKSFTTDQILAQLQFNGELDDFIEEKRDERESLTLVRKTTAFNFSKRDLYKSKKHTLSEHLDKVKNSIPKDTNLGLQRMLDTFIEKTKFLNEVKEDDAVKSEQNGMIKDAYKIFIMNSRNFGELPMPLIFKINQGILQVPSSYTIQEGMAHSLLFAFKNLEIIKDQELYRAHFNNNNMVDRVLGLIIKGLNLRSEFRALTVIGNEFGEESAKHLSSMLCGQHEDTGERGCGLSELRLINVKTRNYNAIDTLIESIAASRTLTRIAIQNTLISERQISNFLNIIEDSHFLELDLSWTKLTSHQIAILLSSLDKNRNLRVLNLSFIKMSSLNVISPAFPKFLNFIQNNRKLTHLNMAQTDLHNKLLCSLILAIKKSQSIQVVHLCGNNPGEEALEIIAKKFKPYSIDYNLQTGSKKHNLLMLVNECLKKQFTKPHDQIYDSVQVKEMLQAWESVRHKYLKRGDNEVTTTEINLMDPTIEDCQQDNISIRDKYSKVTAKYYFEPLIFQKCLGYPEILNSSHWKVANECWMCEKWRYSFIFWNVELGVQHQIQDTNLEQMLNTLLYESEDDFAFYSKQIKVESPCQAYILGSFTNWEPRRMMQIDQLCAMLQKEEIKTEEERHKYWDEVKSEIFSTLRNFSPYPGDKTQYVSKPQNLETNCPEIDFNRLFVYVDFIKPGKHQYVVSYKNQISEVQNQEQKDFMEIQRYGTRKKASQISLNQLNSSRTVNISSYHTFIGRPHMEEFNCGMKVNKQGKKTRVFNKETSVFKEWRLDRPKKICEGFMQEISYWKVANFIKDSEEVEAIIKLLKNNIEFLKTVFVIRASQSHFPVIKWLNYSMLINDLNLYDSHFEPSAVDRIFIAVTKNMDKDLIGILTEKDMNRYQFYESLVRIAFVKFKQQQLTLTVYEGLRVLIDEMKSKFKNYQWMGWRQEKLWQLDIDDLYASNLKAMQLLYKFNFEKKKKKTFSIPDALDLFITHGGLSILPEQIRQQWGLSKQTVENDITQRSQYKNMSFAEFLELFARIADQVYKETTNTLHEKIETLMDHMFTIYGKERKEVVIEIEYISQSEEELDIEKYYKV